MGMAFRSRLARYKRGLISFWRLYRQNKFGMAGLIMLIAFIALAAVADLIAMSMGYRFDELVISVTSVGTITPSALFCAIAYGARVSLIIGITASACSVLLGTLIGMVSGYIGGKVDEVLMRITDFIMMLPRLPLLIVLAAVLRGGGAALGLSNIILVIAILGWAGTARVVRSQVLSLKERPFVEAARAVGASDRYILFKHILPNIMPLVMTYMVLGVPGAILSEASLTFLGLGIDISRSISWGSILYWAANPFYGAGATIYLTRPWVVIPPGLCITLLTLATILMGYAMDEILNPRLRRR